MYIIWLKSDVKQAKTPSPAALIISMIIVTPEDPAALPGFILLIALDTISDLILIAGPCTRSSSLIFAAFHRNSTFKSF